MKIKNKNIVITGGAGFIGTNAVNYFAKNNNVTVIDNLSRTGTKYNLQYLKKKFDIEFYKIDVSDKKTLSNFFKTRKKTDIVLHLAGQVAVTTSIVNPYEDFITNSAGTLNLLESLRENKIKPVVIYSSTNKVYGNLSFIPVKELKTRYIFKNLNCKGVRETENLDFYSPYGCSKGSADQYVKDYCRIYGIPTIVFRQSCIYGDFQYGVEDQGWAAWFMAALLLNKKIRIYGTGKQVRDILYISDLIDAYKKSIEQINDTAGSVFNIGGGIENAVSIIEYLNYIFEKYNLNSELEFNDWRQGDQQIYISNNSKFSELTNWTPEISYHDGIDRLYKWLKSNLRLLLKII
ncbi:NAD-dependent epimerase/dehydratase family protein [Candidatus Dependentiae bacterium]|nr:NAD-dependent epimerase/dehydratase family protein [Candidatus Dependentiae bacterium]